MCCGRYDGLVPKTIVHEIIVHPNVIVQNAAANDAFKAMFVMAQPNRIEQVYERGWWVKHAAIGHNGLPNDQQWSPGDVQ